MATAKLLLTADAFARRPDPGYPEELVRGRIIANRSPTDVMGGSAVRRASCYSEPWRPMIAGT